MPALVVRSSETTATEAPTPTAPPPIAPLPMVISDEEFASRLRLADRVISISDTKASVVVVDLTTTPAPAKPA